MICKIKKSRLMSALLAIAMVVTLMPVTTFAVEPLTLVSAAVTNGGGVGLTFNKELSPTDLVNKVKAGFTITGLEETPKTITNVTLHSVSGGSNNFVQLYLSPTIKGGEAAGLSYTPGDVQSLDGGLLAEIPSMDITNNLPCPMLDTTSPLAATVGSAYTHTFTASGGTAPYTFSVDGGSLPSGLTMSSTGEISGTPTVAASFTFFIMVEDANQAVDIEGFNITVSSPTVYVCEINGTEYSTLDAALAAVPADGTATIQLLCNIDHNEGVALGSKKITFALNGYTLNINNPAEGGVGLDVQQGGAVSLTGSGALNVTGKAYGVRVTSNMLASSATVTNATANGSEGRAAYAHGPAAITVLGDATVTGVNGYGAHAISKAVIDIKGNVNATNQGVYASDAIIIVAGNVLATGSDLISNPVGIGVGTYAGTVEIGGNVTANRVGVMMRNNGKATIDGTVTAPAYIQFNDDEPTAIGAYVLPTTKPGYRTYQHVTAGTVWVKGEIQPDTYALTVESGIGDGNYAAGTTVTITADPAPNGTQFNGWTIVPSVTFTEGSAITLTAKFTMPAQAVTATAAYGALPASRYSITVQNDGNGTASANFNSAAEGAEITLTATPNSGYRFKEWQVISGGVTIADNKFSMLDSNVTVKAIFEPVPVAVYTVSFNLNGGIRTGGGELVQTVASGGSAVPPIVARNGYTFTGWDKVFTNVTQNLTVTAQWSYNGGSSGGDSSSRGSTGSSVAVPPATSIPEKKPDQPVTVVVPITATAGTTGTANASIQDTSVIEAITRAKADAKAQGKTANGIAVVLNVTIPQGTASLTATLTQNALQSLISADVSSLEINGAPVSLNLDMKAMQEIQKQNGGNIIIGFMPVTGISTDAQALIGNRPVYNITISTVKNGETTNITSLGSGTATLSIPYTPGRNEAVGYLFGVYVDGSGNAARITGSVYDVNTEAILIPTSHFSVYGVGYTAPSAKFTDIGNHWAKESIDYVVGRELLSGASKTTFAPDVAMTRGMLVTALGRLAGVDVMAYTKNSFTDVNSDSPFCPYIEWAYNKGIVQGIGNGRFAPDRAITREEIAVIIANYAKATGYKLPMTRNTDAYTDASSIGSIYKDAVTAMQQSGIMMGRDGNKFNSKANATRAEVTAMLHRYIKLTIDPATAQGWAKNDDDQYLYYKDGKALTGWQTIDGAKYFFETNGMLKAGWAKDGDNWRFYSGNRLLVGWRDVDGKRYYFTKDGIMVSSKWLQINGKWYYFYADGSLARSSKVDGYEVDDNGVRKAK